VLAVSGLIDRDAAGRLAPTPDVRVVLKVLLGE
jgi:hypothetical protein